MTSETGAVATQLAELQLEMKIEQQDPFFFFYPFLFFSIGTLLICDTTRMLSAEENQLDGGGGRRWLPR